MIKRAVHWKVDPDGYQKVIVICFFINLSQCSHCRANMFTTYCLTPIWHIMIKPLSLCNRKKIAWSDHLHTSSSYCYVHSNKLQIGALKQRIVTDNFFPHTYSYTRISLLDVLYYNHHQIGRSVYIVNRYRGACA